MKNYAKLLQRKLLTMFSDSLTRAQVSAELDRYCKESQMSRGDRVKLAVLKLAGCDISEIRKQVENAIVDYRDVLAYAEYPNQMKRQNLMLLKEHNELIIELDLQQYKSWLEE